jgi:hypothetical protein
MGGVRTFTPANADNPTRYPFIRITDAIGISSNDGTLNGAIRSSQGDPLNVEVGYEQILSDHITMVANTACCDSGGNILYAKRQIVTTPEQINVGMPGDDLTEVKVCVTEYDDGLWFSVSYGDTGLSAHKVGETNSEMQVVISSTPPYDANYLSRENWGQILGIGYGFWENIVGKRVAILPKDIEYSSKQLELHGLIPDPKAILSSFPEPQRYIPKARFINETPIISDATGQNIITFPNGVKAEEIVVTVESNSESGVEHRFVGTEIRSSIIGTLNGSTAVGVEFSNAASLSFSPVSEDTLQLLKEEDSLIERAYAAVDNDLEYDSEETNLYDFLSGHYGDIWRSLVDCQEKISERRKADAQAFVSAYLKNAGFLSGNVLQVEISVALPEAMGF